MQYKPVHIIIRFLANSLLLLLSFLLLTMNGFSQKNDLNQKISIRFDKVSLENALDSIAKKTNTNFTYNTHILLNKDLVNIEVQNRSLYEVLRLIIPDTTLDFQQINKQIIIFPAKQKTTITDDILKPKIRLKKIRGKIIDKKNRTALAYASIGLEGKAIGTISNIDGEFLLNLESKYFNDTLVFSFIGFKNTEIPINKIVSDEITVELTEHHISLQEVVIRNTDPLALVKSAIHNFDQNYPDKPTYLTAFYRESVSKNKNYMIYLESIINVYKSSYQSLNNRDMAKVFQSRKIYDSNRLDTISLRLKGGVEGCLKLDIVKNKIDFLDLENLHDYNFHFYDISSYNNSPVYVITFEPKPKLNYTLMQGYLYIDTRSLAIIKADFSYSTKHVAKLKQQFVAKKSSRTKVRPLKIEYSVSYKNINGKYYLNHTKGNLKFKVRKKRKFFSKIFETRFEMAVTQVDTLNIERFKYRERLRSSTVMSKSILPYDRAFWGSQNYIEPEENIQKALKRINANLFRLAKNKE